jgi:hypothetical protein
MKNDKVYGILLFDIHLSDILKPYLQKGPIGKFIYGTKAVHDGVFLNITVSSDRVNGRVKDNMEISIPLGFIKFIASASSIDNLIGFRSSKKGKQPT